MVCLACHSLSGAILCTGCARSLRAAPERLIPGGVPLIGAFEHTGAARVLVHHFKYRGLTAYAELAAEIIAERMPRVPLVPVPRALSRRLKYGVDPGRALAQALGRRLRVPIVDALRPPLHAPRRAGRDHSRPVAAFRARTRLRYPVAVVDDVVTTGATVSAAIEAIGSQEVVAVASANVVANVVRSRSNVVPGD